MDVRLVSMADSDLSGEVAARRFWQDLFHRVVTLRLRIQPLGERGDDVT